MKDLTGFKNLLGLSKRNRVKQDFFEPGYYYHVYNRGNNRENIFKEERNHNHLLSLIEKHLIIVSKIHSYCLMPNHFHLLVKIKPINEIPEKYKNRVFQPFSNLFNAYTKAFNKMYGRTGSLFQEHLHRKRILDEDYLKQIIVYIHLNPVKHKFTEDHRYYKYSSFNSILSNNETKVDSDSVLKLFDGKENYKYVHKASRNKRIAILDEIELLDI